MKTARSALRAPWFSSEQVGLFGKTVASCLVVELLAGMGAAVPITRTWAPRIWGQEMGSEGSRLAETERGVWFWLKRHSICTPHFNRKYELMLFRGRKTILPPEFWSPDQDSGGFADLDCVLGSLDTLRHLAQKVCRAEAPAFEHCEALRMRVSLPHEVMLCKRACPLKRGRVGRAASRLAADARERSDYLLKRRHDTRWRSHAHTPSETFVRGRSKAVAACWTSSSKDPCFVGSTATLQTQSARARAQHSEPGEGCRRLHSCEVAPQGAPSRSGCRLAGA